jgi:hypothetical protein
MELSAERERQNKPADREKQPHTSIAMRDERVQHWGKWRFLSRLRVDMKEDHGKDRDEAQSIDLGKILA